MLSGRRAQSKTLFRPVGGATGRDETRRNTYSASTETLPVIATSRHPARATGPRREPHPRRAVVLLEMILALPLLVILVMAIVEFGLLFSNEQIVEMASRAGTQVASELATIPASGAVPVEISNAVAVELARIGVTGYRIRLEHNIDTTAPPATVATPVVLETTYGGGPTTTPSVPAVSVTSGVAYVRVTVTVFTTDLTPNLLSNYCVDLAGRVSSQTKLRRYVL